MRIFIFLLTALLTLPLVLPAQQIQNDLFFSTLTTRDGLPSNLVSCIAQDDHGFMWLGTSNGLCRYDGNRFKIFKKSDSKQSLIDNEISALLVDGNDLWVGTWRGLCRMNTQTFEIRWIDLGQPTAIRTLYKDSRGNVLIGTTDGLYRGTSKNSSFKRMSATENGLSHNTIRHISEDESGNLWVGTYDGLNRLASGSDRFERFDLKGNYKPSLKNHLVMDVKPVGGTDPALWVGTETGLYKLNPVTGEKSHFENQNTGLSNEVIKHIYSDPDGRLWLGTDFGLNVVDPANHSRSSYFHNPQVSHSIANNVIWQIFEDHGGVIWFATSNGLSRINKYRTYYDFQEVTHQINGQTIGNQVKALLVSTDGYIWMATMHGVLRMDPITKEQKLFDTGGPPNERLLLNNVSALEEDDVGRIWIGTAGGINIWDRRTGTMSAVTVSKSNGLTSNYISKFTKGPDGSMWVSAWEGGLFRVIQNVDDPGNMRFEKVGDFAGPQITYALNALWAVRNGELFRIDMDNYKTTMIPSFNTLASGKDIYTLYYAPNQSLWAGTSNGLIEYGVQTDSAVFYPIITGNDFELNNIISDSSGDIWAATNNKVLKFNTTEEDVELFPLDADLPLKTFSQNCVARSNTGQIIFGGDNGFISIRSDVRPNNYNPSVYITELALNNKPVLPFQAINDEVILTNDISFSSLLELPYAQRSIAFEFASLHYWQPDNNVFAYHLDGFDQEWNYVSGLRNFAVYSNLPPGTYTLRVRGTNNFGIWSKQESSLKIIVSPPLFLSKPFLAIYAVLVVGLVVLGFRIYAIRLKYRTQLKLARIEKEHAEEIVQAKQKFFTNISHELRTPISLIIPPIQEIIKKDTLDEETRSLITIAEKNSQRLLRLINQILDFRRLEHENKTLTISWFDLVMFARELYSLFSDKAARKEIDFTFHSSVTECPLWADREKLEIILFNLLSNAFKFTPKKGRVSLTIDHVPEKANFTHGAVMITVSDTGIGISKEDQARIFEQFFQASEARKMEDGSGIGLTLVSEYTRLHNGKINVESNKGQGTRFTVFLPLGDSHFPVNDSQQQKEVALLATPSPAKVYQFDLRSTKPVVLLAEDNPDMTSFIEVTLKHKYNFVTAENGKEALAKAHSLIPDVIISDIMMPEMDGLTFCRHIKKDNKTSHIPIILLTARGLTSQVIEGIRVGADIYMTKPFDVALLEAHIDHLMERQKELAEYFKSELITEPISANSNENEDDKFLKKVMNTIEANISNPDFSVEMLSDEIGMSSTHLYRKLKSLTQITGNEIIKRYRLKKASLLLRNKEGNISEIMYEVGFSNLSYFIKCFKNEFDITPKEFQQQQSRHSFSIDEKFPH